MALGLGRYYDVNPGTAYEHDGPGSSVVQVSHLPHSRPWLQTLAGGRSSQLNTARSSFWMDEKDALLDPSGLDQDYPIFNDVYVGSMSRGSRQLLGDDNDWYMDNPQTIGSFSGNQAIAALKDIMNNLDPGSPLAGYIKDLLALKGGSKENMAAYLETLRDYMNVYQTVGGRDIGATNNIMNASAQVDIDTNNINNVALVSQYMQVAQAWVANPSNPPAIFTIGAAVMESAGTAASAFDFSQLETEWNQLVAGQPEAAYQLAWNIVDQGTQLPNDPHWAPWPGVTDLATGNGIELPPSLWSGFVQSVDDPVSISVPVNGTTVQFNGSAAQLAMNEAIFNAAVYVHAMWEDFYGGGSSVAIPIGYLTASTPVKGGGGLTLGEKIALGVAAGGLILLITRQIVTQ